MTSNTPLAELPLFTRLSPQVRSCLLQKSVLRQHRRGEILSRQGDQNPTLKVVVSGWVKLYRTSPRGSEATLAMIEHGHSFDEVPALVAGHAMTSSVAVSNCAVLHLDLSDTCSCQDAFQDLHLTVLTAASDHAHAMINHIEQLKGKTSVQRLSEFLVDLSDAKGRNGQMTLPYDKKVLAGKLGMKPESLSRAFRQLKPFGVQSDERQIRLGDVPGLREFAKESAL